MQLEDSVEIRPLTPDAWQLHRAVRLAALADAPYAFTTRLADVAGRSDDEWADLTRRRAQDPNGITYFAYVDGEPCGMAACVLTDLGAEMLAVWVAPQRRRQGVAEAMVDYARAWALGHGVARLVVGVYADNHGAVALYRSVGFVATGEHRVTEQAEAGQPILIMAMGSEGMTG